MHRDGALACGVRDPGIGCDVSFTSLFVFKERGVAMGRDGVESQVE